MKSIIMALLPGLEDETSEDFDRTLSLVESFKNCHSATKQPVSYRKNTRPAMTSSGSVSFWPLSRVEVGDPVH